ncbi:unnamed protein product [Psylliodes chrysocephalus]|uniref:Uncharacterized protein n=1 Tax=Psylliodes chrysocephalus TaxID=3402493 RepID=A0A9P0D538_9CUCU|nr:unnamed protein product [Psylliodes chrysocephala]
MDDSGSESEPFQESESDYEPSEGSDISEVEGHEAVPTQNIDPIEQNIVLDIITQQNVATDISKKTRKRSLNKNNWKTNIKKRRRNCGEEYISSSGRLVPSKTFQDKACNCKQNCSNKIQEDQRKIMFESFWKLETIGTENNSVNSEIQSETEANQNVRDNKDSWNNRSGEKSYGRNKLYR